MCPASAPESGHSRPLALASQPCVYPRPGAPAGAGAASSRSYAPATGFVSCALFENRRAVLRESALRGGAVLGLLELQCLAEVVRGAGVVTAEGEGVERPVERVEGIGAERPAEAGTACRAHERVTEDLGLPACVGDGRPRIGRAAVAEGDGLDLERLEPKPTRDVERVAGRLRRTSGQAELSGRGRVVAGVTDLPDQRVRRVVDEAPAERVA